MIRSLSNVKDTQAGFSLIELLVAITIGGVLIAMSASPLRNYWLTRSLTTAAGEAVSQMEQVQERAVSETHPLVYGLRFRTGTSEWAIVRFDPGPNLTSETDDVCTTVGTRTFADVTIATTTSFQNAGRPTALCSVGFDSTYRFAFFFAKGSATPGDLYLIQRSVNKTRRVSLAGLTGRAEVVD